MDVLKTVMKPVIITVEVGDPSEDDHVPWMPYLFQENNLSDWNKRMEQRDYTHPARPI